MCPTTKRMLQLILFLVLTALLASCGSDDSDPALVSIYSTPAYAGHGIAFSNNSTVTTSGANGFGQLGNGTYNNSSIPSKVRPPGSSFTAVTAVAAGSTHCVVLDNGAVWTWGYNIYGQLGNDSVIGSNIPVKAVKKLPGTELVADLADVKAIAAGGLHTLAVSADNTVLAWGQNSRGQLGMANTTAFAKTAQEVTDLAGKTITAVAAGGEFSLALDSDGNVWAWGDNTYGQLGDRTAVTSPSPVPVLTNNDVEDPNNPGTFIPVPLTNIVAIAAGGSHALAIDAEGNVWAWGYNYFGQLGTGDAVTRTSAVKVTIDGLASKIAAGLDHSLVLTSSGLYSSGYNALGELGLGGPVGTPPYVIKFTKVMEVVGMTVVESISAYGHFSMARAGGRIYTWGDNSYGQLGFSGVFNTSTPTISGY